MKKYTIKWSVIAENEDQVWADFDELVHGALRDECTLANTLLLEEEELTEEEKKEFENG